MDKLEADIAAVEVKIDGCEKALKKCDDLLEQDYESWLPTDKNKYANHDTLRRKKLLLGNEKLLLLEDKNSLLELSLRQALTSRATPLRDNIAVKTHWINLKHSME